MDSIHSAFCDAVVGTIKDLPCVDVPFPDANWNSAFQDHSANRKCFMLDFAFSDGQWYYSLLNTRCGSQVPLTTVLQQVGPNYLRIDYIQCVGDGWSFTKTSKEEIYVLIESLRPFVNFPKLRLDDVNSTIPENDVAELLSTFAEINICSFISSCNAPSVMEFAMKLLRDPLLKELLIQEKQKKLNCV